MKLMLCRRYALWLWPAMLLLLSLLLPAAAAAENELATEEGGITARAAILMDRETGRVLWEKNAQLRLPMASTTKIMTAILALELGNEADVITTSKRAAATEGSSIWLEEGEQKTLEELLYGLMLLSGNDAAVAIAEHIAGSVENFAALMNEKAAAIGATNTHFCNPHGLPDDRHYTTAYDLALISAYALQNERFREIIRTPEYIISWPGREWDRVLQNQNRLLELYPGGDGVKTGWTKEAGRCFVGSATREGWQLVAVVLNAPQMWEDTMRLLDYGFETYSRQKVLYQGQVICTAEVYKGTQ
ncbi:MAG TPA: D-alanyl-D-alanine carboxypeptidase family protein, partial [Bacillota bacterium]|nr:D-alanyl-D-alanine carboxypeptidase family protein [Bacillota bacterium]